MAVDPNLLQPIVGDTSAEFKTTIDGFTISTPGHADYFNHVFKQLVDNDTVNGELAKPVTNLRLNVIDMAIELETVKNATLTGVTANMAIETFLDVSDIVSLNSALKFDSDNQKVYLP